jgi:hypothetical protein
MSFMISCLARSSFAWSLALAPPSSQRYLSFSRMLLTHLAGYNHSGKLGEVNFLNGVMGYANAQRMLDYIRVIVEFISQPQYKDLVPMFGIVNEGGYLLIVCEMG